jgi:hypothetical protein
VAIILHPLKGSGDFDRGASGFNGKILWLCLGAASQDQAYDAALANAPPAVGNLIRSKVSVQEEAGAVGLYRLEVSYENVKPGNGPDAGKNPGASSPAASKSPDAHKDVGPELSFSTGGGTEHIVIAKKTTGYARQKNGVPQQAPDVGNLIGLNFETGEVAGCDVLSRKCEFNITRRFATLQVGYLLHLFWATATLNADYFYGASAGEVLFQGGDGHYKGGDQEYPWTISGKFGYSPNQVGIDVIGDGSLVVADAGGWDYLWFGYSKTTVAVNGKNIPVSRPTYAYVAEVYETSDFSLLAMNIGS